MTSAKRILISGTTRGLGLSLARHYLDQGWEVHGCGRSASAIHHSAYHHAQLDLTIEGAVVEWIHSAATRGPVTAAIYNAAVARLNPALLLPTRQLEEIMGVNFTGAHSFCRESAKSMMRQRTGRIVLISSAAVKQHMPGEAAYVASKAALEAYAKVLARELAPTGITVNVLSLPLLEEGLSRGVSEERKNELREEGMFAKMCAPEDVAYAVDCFLSERASLISGQVLALGGL